jgi:putative transposase
MTLVADTSLSGVRVARELDRLTIDRQADDGGQRQRQQLTSNAILTWADHAGIDWH